MGGQGNTAQMNPGTDQHLVKYDMGGKHTAAFKATAKP